MKGINEVKKDLRELKCQMHALRSLEVASKTHEMRIKLLACLPKSEKTAALLENEEQLIRKIDASGALLRAEQLELYYIDAINKLSPTDKSIIVDTFLNGLPYWKIGAELGFSEETIRKRVNKAILEIAKTI